MLRSSRRLRRKAAACDDTLRRRRPARLLAVPLGAVLLVLLSACKEGLDAGGNVWWRGGLPSPVTVQGHRILTLWQGSMIAALCVGAFVIGLILWACLWYRKRSDQLPRQVRYNLPIEILYTSIPVVIIAVLFYFTATDESYEDRLSAHPDMTVEVVGFQWSWQFNYLNQHLSVTGRPGQPPELVLPVGESIRFIERSPDVIHSFWVVPFLFKRDVIPGRDNQFELTIDKKGTFAGKCAEYCGVDHDRMLFSVRAVSRSDYQNFMRSATAAAASGQSSTFTVMTSAQGSTP